jgi:hypothetical protein
MELNAEVFMEKIAELQAMMAVIRSNSTEPKVNVEKLVSSFDEDEASAYKKIMDLVYKVDRLVHANYMVNVAQAINAELKKVAADSAARTMYLVTSDDKARKAELDGDVVELIGQAKKLKAQIEGMHDFLVASDVAIPDAAYKQEDGKVVLTKANNKVLNLPRIFDVSEDADTSKRGRPSRSQTLILGTDTDGEVTWHDNDIVGKTFLDIFGTVRSEHNQFGLFKAVEKALPEVTISKGWDTPVEYAGKLWVAKVRS